jgi:hypothetical protein
MPIPELFLREGSKFYHTPGPLPCCPGEGGDSLPPMRSPRSQTTRAALALTLFSGWLALLFWGFAFGGGVHLLLAAGLALFPWRAARA